MSRRIRVSDSRRHDRGELVRQRVRHDRRRWRASKQQVSPHTLEFHLDGPEAARVNAECIEQLKAHLGQAGPVLYLQPEQMRRLPADLRRCFEPFVRARTEIRVKDAPSRPTSKPRAREKRRWLRDAELQLA